MGSEAAIAAIIAAVVSAVGTATATGASAGATADITSMNQKFQRNVNNWNWIFAYLQNQQQMQREDTAIQRRVADMKAAGLSPVLAAGNGAASSMGPTFRAEPLNANRDLAFIQQAQSGLTQSLDMALKAIQLQKTEQETKWIKTQNENAQDVIDAKIAKTKADTAKAGVEAGEKSYNVKKFQELGIPTNSGAVTKDAGSMIQLTKELINQYKQTGKVPEARKGASGSWEVKK